MLIPAHDAIGELLLRLHLLLLLRLYLSRSIVILRLRFRFKNAASGSLLPSFKTVAVSGQELGPTSLTLTES